MIDAGKNRNSPVPENHGDLSAALKEAQNASDYFLIYISDPALPKNGRDMSAKLPKPPPAFLIGIIPPAPLKQGGMCRRLWSGVVGDTGFEPVTPTV